MRFQDVTVSRCSAGHLVYDVVYADGSSERFHDGQWPPMQSIGQADQLRAARINYLALEER